MDPIIVNNFILLFMCTALPLYLSWPDSHTKAPAECAHILHGAKLTPYWLTLYLLCMCKLQRHNLLWIINYFKFTEHFRWVGNLCFLSRRETRPQGNVPCSSVLLNHTVSCFSRTSAQPLLIFTSEDIYVYLFCIFFFIFAINYEEKYLYHLVEIIHDLVKQTVYGLLHNELLCCAGYNTNWSRSVAARKSDTFTAILFEFSQQEIDVMWCTGVWPEECFRDATQNNSTCEQPHLLS